MVSTWYFGHVNGENYTFALWLLSQKRQLQGIMLLALRGQHWKIILFVCLFDCKHTLFPFWKKKNTPSLPFVYIACSDDMKEFQGRPHKSFCIKCKKMAIRNPHQRFCMKCKNLQDEPHECGAPFPRINMEVKLILFSRNCLLVVEIDSFLCVVVQY